MLDYKSDSGRIFDRSIFCSSNRSPMLRSHSISVTYFESTRPSLSLSMPAHVSTPRGTPARGAGIWTQFVLERHRARLLSRGVALLGFVALNRNLHGAEVREQPPPAIYAIYFIVQHVY